MGKKKIKIPDLTVAQFADMLQGSGRLLGLDLGTKTIGMAVCDKDWSFASPVKTILRQKFTTDVEELVAFAKLDQTKGIVMGLPLNMDDSEGPRAQATRAFVRNMAQFTDLPVLFWDERLSSNEANLTLKAGHASRRKRESNIDNVAAAIILQGCIDKLYEIVSTENDQEDG